MTCAWSLQRWAGGRLLDYDRHRAFEAFYVAVRTSRLTQPEAQDSWDGLQAVESRRDALRSAWSWEASRAVGRAYQTAGTLGEGTRRIHSPAELVEFGGLYISIVLGRISLSQLERRRWRSP